MSTSYSYTPLDLSQRSLRLLRIEKAESNLQIRCSLRQTTNDENTYIALSYMWHPEDSKAHSAGRTILLNGKQFSVTENLWNFLNTAQNELHEHEFWIDAICINQLDNTERGHQVSHMHQIYSQAASVLVWLGPGNAETREFLNFVNEGSWNSQFFIQHGGYFLNSSGYRPQDLDQTHSTLRDGLLQMIRKPYWGRVWIVQELLLAKQIEIMMGSQRMNWHAFFEPMDIQEHAGSAEAAGGGERMSHVRLFRDNPDGMVKPDTLEGLVTYFSDQACSDARDRIYAMLGIANQRDGFEVDYNCSTVDVLEYTFQHIKIHNFLSAVSIIDAMKIQRRDATNKFSDKFLDSSFSVDQSSRLVEVKSTDSRNCETVSSVPREWVVKGASFTITACTCATCLPKNVYLTPQDGDIVVQVPHSDLLVLCRRLAGTAVYNCVGGLESSRRFNFDQPRSFQCFMPYDGFTKLSIARIDTSVNADISTDGMVAWNLTWRTILAIAEHARCGVSPGLVVLVGSMPHDRWLHRCSSGLS